MKSWIWKLLLLVSITLLPQISTTYASFSGVSTAQSNLMSAGWWVAPSIAITSPSGGETWEVGSTHLITWTAASTDPTATVKIDIYLSTDSGATFPTLLAQGLDNTGSYAWLISNPYSDTMKVKIVVTDSHNLVSTAISNVFDPKTPVQPSLKMFLNDNRQHLLFTLSGIDKIAKYSYQLVYDTDLVPQGVMGGKTVSGIDQITEDILLGSCSSGGTCTYHSGIKNIQLQVNLQSSDGALSTLSDQLD